MHNDDNKPQSETPGVPHRLGEPSRSQRDNDIPASTKDPSTPKPTDRIESATPPSFSADELKANPILLAQVTAYLQENHLHLPLLTPDLGEMKRMREYTPELYRAYVKAIDAQIDADHTARTLPYTEPASIAKRGQHFGFLSVMAVLLLRAFLAFLGHIVSASVIAAFDLVALASVFANKSNDS